MERLYTLVEPEFVEPRLRQRSRDLAMQLAALFDLPEPRVAFVEPLGAGARRGDAHLAQSDMDVNVRAALLQEAPDTIWVELGSEHDVLRGVAHELGHIAELLGAVPQRRDIEEFPQMLTHAVVSMYEVGMNWLDRLLESNLYLRALADGRLGRDESATWSRRDYWFRLSRTRGRYAYLDLERGDEAPEPVTDLPELPEPPAVRPTLTIVRPGDPSMMPPEELPSEPVSVEAASAEPSQQTLVEAGEIGAAEASAEAVTPGIDGNGASPGEGDRRDARRSRQRRNLLLQLVPGFRRARDWRKEEREREA